MAAFDVVSSESDLCQPVCIESSVLYEPAGYYTTLYPADSQQSDSKYYFSNL